MPTPLPPAVTGYSRYPLLLRFAPCVAGDADFVAAVRVASTTWNQALGETVFKLNQGGIGCSVVVDLLVPTPAIVGWVDDVDDPGAMRLSLDYVLSPDANKRAVVLHEEGHLLGLSHAKDPADVMFPQLGRATTLSSADIARAKALLLGSR